MSRNEVTRTGTSPFDFGGQGHSQRRKFADTLRNIHTCLLNAALQIPFGFSESRCFRMHAWVERSAPRSPVPITVLLDHAVFAGGHSRPFHEVESSGRCVVGHPVPPRKGNRDGTCKAAGELSVSVTSTSLPVAVTGAGHSGRLGWRIKHRNGDINA